MKNEEWRMKNEEWRMKNEDEEWRMKNEEWRMKNEEWRMKNEESGGGPEWEILQFRSLKKREKALVKQGFAHADFHYRKTL